MCCTTRPWVMLREPTGACCDPAPQLDAAPEPCTLGGDLGASSGCFDGGEGFPCSHWCFKWFYAGETPCACTSSLWHVLPRLGRDPRAAGVGLDGSTWWSPRPGRDGVSGLAGSGWMVGGSEETGDISHQTWGSLWCRSRSLSVLSSRAGPPGLGAAEACLEAGFGASICAASSPAKKREMALLLCGNGSRGPGGLAKCQLPAAATAAFSEHPARCGGPVKVITKVRDVLPCWLLPPALGSHAAPRKQNPGGDAAVHAACAVVGQLLCMGVLGERRHAPRLGAGK